MKKILKKIIPKNILNLRHLFFAWYGAIKYKYPSKELLVIGITGTSGKSTTAYLLRQLLESSGFVVGSLSTIDFYVAGRDKLNDTKMTMLGKTEIQKYLREMVNKKCDIAIVETTSEGIVQYRHKFINYDYVLLTNLYPEHIESHGSFENYKNAKLKLFEYTANKETKVLKGKPIDKKVFVNENIKQASEFVNFNFSKKIGFGKKGEKVFVKNLGEEFILDNVETTEKGLEFEINNKKFNTKLFGEHNALNILSAVSVARELMVDWSKINKSVKNFAGVPGRLEFIEEAEEFGFQVIVDYAFEPIALKSLYRVVKVLKPKRIIHVCGSAGGGRDRSRRGPIGELVGRNADICIVTNEDPYDEDPMEIIKQVSGGAKKSGKKLDKNLFEILDRGEAIQKAVNLVKKGDLILVTGKGSEQAIVVENGKKIDWDDREVIKKELRFKK
ncbi:MAG: UDP-N-acetylmuramyl-tripeptide synthetase [Candidatus Magasanikbacteria bacterium]|nr:UDP-N-acetylmuramyl-tripeptide synthetase [Candidatus Magasanikbacteria bacterium]